MLGVIENTTPSLVQIIPSFILYSPLPPKYQKNTNTEKNYIETVPKAKKNGKNTQLCISFLLLN